jgi:hypothetical protein
MGKGTSRYPDAEGSARMAKVEPEVDRVEQALRFLLLLAFWTLWLLVRAAWGILCEVASVHSRNLIRRTLSWATLAGLVFLSPHAVGLWWSRMMLMDAAEVAALQAEGRDPLEIESELRRKAFQLGFRDIIAQPEAIQVHRKDHEAGTVCRVILDFRHQPKIYGWTTPPLRIQASVERYVLPAREGGWKKELVEVL